MNGETEAREQTAARTASRIVTQLRKWLALNRGIDLSEADVAQVFSFIDAADISQGIVGTLKSASRAMDPAPAALSLLLARTDFSGNELVIGDGFALRDMDSLVIGIYARLRASAYGYPLSVEKEAIYVRFQHDKNGEAARDITLRVLADIHDVLSMQHEHEQRG